MKNSARLFHAAALIAVVDSGNGVFAIGKIAADGVPAPLLLVQSVKSDATGETGDGVFCLIAVAETREAAQGFAEGRDEIDPGAPCRVFEGVWPHDVAKLTSKKYTTTQGALLVFPSLVMPEVQA